MGTVEGSFYIQHDARKNLSQRADGMFVDSFHSDFTRDTRFSFPFAISSLEVNPAKNPGVDNDQGFLSSRTLSTKSYLSLDEPLATIKDRPKQAVASRCDGSVVID
jgi:hypothetical protein